MVNDNYVVVSHNLCGLQGRVGGRVVVMEPVMVVPFSPKHLKTSQYE
jgi:hypothetical protein